MVSSHFPVHKYFCMSQNKSVLNWTQVCQLLCYSQVKTQLHENIIVAFSKPTIIMHFVRACERSLRGQTWQRLKKQVDLLYSNY